MQQQCATGWRQSPAGFVLSQPFSYIKEESKTKKRAASSRPVKALLLSMVTWLDKGSKPGR